MLEYLTRFVPQDTDEKMTHALNVVAADGWSMSRFEPEMGNVPGYRVVWVKDHGPVAGEHQGGPAHAHVQMQAIPFNQLPPAMQQIIQAMGGPGDLPGFTPKPHKPPEKGP